ncbi:unnamed protein product, partial [Boreogadus saida]
MHAFRKTIKSFTNIGPAPDTAADVRRQLRVPVHGPSAGRTGSTRDSLIHERLTRTCFKRWRVSPEEAVSSCPLHATPLHPDGALPFVSPSAKNTDE